MLLSREVRYQFIGTKSLLRQWYVCEEDWLKNSMMT